MIKVDWGTDQKCDICGSRKDLWYEPRFHYYSCEEHKDIPPAYRDKQR